MILADVKLTSFCLAYFSLVADIDSCVDDKRLELVKHIVASGADLNVSDNEGWRPIYQAAHGGNEGPDCCLNKCI